MTATELVMGNLESLVILAALLGGIIWQTKHQSKRFDNIDNKFERLDDKDDKHDEKIAELDKLCAVNSAKIESQSGVLSELKDKIDKLYALLTKK